MSVFMFYALRDFGVMRYRYKNCCIILSPFFTPPYSSPLQCENLVVKVTKTDDIFWADDKVCYKSLKTSEGIGRAGLFDKIPVACKQDIR